jgi:hypothetical protein
MSGQGAASASSGWTTQPFHPVHRLQAFGVSCSRPGFCFTVGTTYSKHNYQVSYRWNGTRWRQAQIPVPADSQDFMFSGVSCYPVAHCLAVASYRTVEGSSLGFGLTGEYWTGTQWQQEPISVPSGDQAELNAVSCPAAATCVAVGGLGKLSGSGYSKGLVEAWNGTSWTVEPTPRLGHVGVVLNGVSCVSPDSCVAVGVYYQNADTERSVVESWDGTSWTVQPTSRPAGEAGSDLVGVSCSSSAACTAVGHYSTASGKSRQLILRWNGTAWSTEHVPAGNNAFNAVSCATDTSCTAVGASFDSSGNPSALVIQWNGTRWTTQPTPAVQGALNAVSCQASGFCMAAGYQGDDDPLSEDN